MVSFPRVPHQDPIRPLSSPTRATCPAHLILLDFITRTILGEEYRSGAIPLVSISVFMGRTRRTLPFIAHQYCEHNIMLVLQHVMCGIWIPHHIFEVSDHRSIFPLNYIQKCFSAEVRLDR